MPAPMTLARESEILDAYKRYRSVRAAAYVCSTGVDQVRRVARAAGVLRPWGGKAPLPALAELEQLVKRLGSQGAAARHLGVCRNTVGNRLRGMR